MKIEKMNNGVLRFEIERDYDFDKWGELDVDSIYHNDLFFSDIAIVDGYLMDFNKLWVYDIFSHSQNYLIEFKKMLEESDKGLIIYPLEKKESEKLIELTWELDNEIDEIIDNHPDFM